MYLFSQLDAFNTDRVIKWFIITFDGPSIAFIKCHLGQGCC